MGGDAVTGGINYSDLYAAFIQTVFFQPFYILFLQVSNQESICVQYILLLFSGDKIIVLLCLSVHIEISSVGGNVTADYGA